MSEELKVRYRGGFSDRRKISPLSTEMQLKNFDEVTRNKLANLIKGWCDVIRRYNNETYFFKWLLNDVYGEFVDDDLIYEFKHEYSRTFEKYIYEPIRSKNYHDVLDIIEYATNCASHFFQEINNRNVSYDNLIKIDCQDDLNGLFEREYVGYRMIDGEITPITDETEIKTIEDSLDIEFEGCRSHIKKSIGFLSDRENPDYKNSIKESISAVEAMCRIILSDDSITLGKALNQLEKKGFPIHHALKEAFVELYGFASNEGGIRHSEGIAIENNVSFEEAKYFVVACSAFVNYLKSKFGKFGGGLNND